MEKKSHHKSKEKPQPKDQRKGRQPRHHVTTTVTEDVPQKPIEKAVTEKPATEEPGPEFYQNLKRETDEILKITEGESAKYKKKEIQSNWKKYEVPIDSYEVIEDLENEGADYEKLIASPFTVGTHFQFKHEKTWNEETAPSEYDKYFKIDMQGLAQRLSTIPFYERNNVDLKLFQPGEITAMTNRALRNKQKFCNENVITPEMEAEVTILNKLKGAIIGESQSQDDTSAVSKTIRENDKRKLSGNKTDLIDSIKHENIENNLVEVSCDEMPRLIHDQGSLDKIHQKEEINTKTEIDFKEITVEKPEEKIVLETKDPSHDEITDTVDKKTKDLFLEQVSAQNKLNIPSAPTSSNDPVTPKEPSKMNVLTANEEDLEKWLDDYLDT